MKKLLLFIFFVFVILPLVILFWPNKDKKINLNEVITNTSTPSPELKNVYANKDYLFSFQYPQDVTLLEKKNQNNRLLEIEFENFERKTTLIISNASSDVVDKSEIVQTQDQEINGIMWKNMQPRGKCYSGGECEIPFFILETTKNDYKYTFYIEYTYIEPKLNEVLSSFTFNN